MSGGEQAAVRADLEQRDDVRVARQEGLPGQRGQVRACGPTGGAGAEQLLAARLTQPRFAVLVLRLLLLAPGC